MRTAAIVLSLALSVSALADAVEEVRQAEIGFAKAFADRDKTKFFSYVAPDAVFMSALGTLRGRDQVVERWSRFFDNVLDAPFSWGPERVEVTAGGTVGFSMGPIYDRDGEHIGYYSSIWQKQGDRTWKIVFDGPGNPPAPLPENAAPVEEGFVTTSDGVRLHYRKAGRGPVTMIVPLEFALYQPMTQFADVATIIAYDPRNRGLSSRVDDVKMLTIGHEVSDLEAVRDHFKAEKIVPVGFSYLGKVVVMYAAAHPDRVVRVVQIGPAPNGAMEERAPETDFGAPPEVLARWKEVREAGGIEKTPREACEAQQAVMRFYLVGSPMNAGRIGKKETCAMENEWPVNVNRHFATLWPTIQGARLSEEQLKKVSMPVLIIHGTKDRNAPYEGGREWASILPNARLVTVEGAAHAAWADDPVAVFGAIRHFLRNGEWPLGSGAPNTEH